MDSNTNQTTETTTKVISQATKEAAARWQAKKAARLAKKAKRANNPTHRAAIERRAASAADATRHYMQADDLMTGAIVSRM